MVDISGRCDDGFGAVKDAFAANFADDGDVGASVAVTIDGELVVDLWGGTQDRAGTMPWERGHDHQRLLDDEDDDAACRCSCWPAAACVDVDAPVDALLAGVRRRRQGQRARAPPAVAHRRAAGVGAAPRRRPTCTTGTRSAACSPSRRRGGSRAGSPATTASPRATSSARSSAASTAARSARSSPRRSPGRSAPTSTSARGPSTTTASPLGHPAAAAAVGSADGSPVEVADGLDPVPRRQPAARRRGVVDHPVAAGRDPRRRRPRQRPQRGPRPVGRCRPAARRAASSCSPRRSIDRIFDVQAAGRDLVLGIGVTFGVGYGLNSPRTRSPRTSASATGAGGAARWWSTTSTPG